ncbi:MAG TPA: hypothetical protein VNU72_00755 [Puia sp.]|jgi:hypothetical protein|nr:hypothetical protein [Puia sp.]
MQKHLPIVLPAAALVLAFAWASCSKSKSTDPGNPTVNLVTAASWKYDTSGIDLNKDGVVDIGGDSLITACQKDDIYTFKSDSTGTLDEGATKCHVGDPQTAPFTWSLTTNQTVLAISSNTLLSGNINIFSLSSTKWVLYKDTTISNIGVRYIVQLKH